METVSLLKAASYQDNLGEKLIQLLEPLGGLASVCKRGDPVLLKPNFIMARSVESGATTHPALILALAQLLADMGCRVAVGDSPGLGSAASVVRRLNLTEQLQQLGAKIVELETPALKEPVGALHLERRFKNLSLAGQINDYAVIINLPKLKSHGQMGLTLATKNLFGCVAGPAKVRWHYAVGRDYDAFARLLVEIAFTVNAHLHILDGIIGMDGNGPSHGRLRELNLLLAAANPIALDRVVVEVLQRKPEQFPIFKAAKAMGVPGGDLAEINLVGEPLSSYYIKDFEIPATRELNLLPHQYRLLNRMLALWVRDRIIINHKTCTLCRRCENHCPARAISITDKISINPNECIHCYCCQELCPVGAMTVSVPLFMKIIKRIWLKITLSQ